MTEKEQQECWKNTKVCRYQREGGKLGCPKSILQKTPGRT
jgi:hypothetical protein